MKQLIITIAALLLLPLAVMAFLFIQKANHINPYDRDPA